MVIIGKISQLYCFEEYNYGIKAYCQIYNILDYNPSTCLEYEISVKRSLTSAAARTDEQDTWAKNFSMPKNCQNS
jgi:hypothetical protein